MKQPCLSVDPPPLLRNPVFRSYDRVASHDLVARELADHSIRWRRGDMGSTGTSLYKGTLRQARMYMLRYGPEVDIKPCVFDDFMLVHTSLRVAAQIECDGQQLQVPEGRSAVLAPRHDIHLNWLSGSEALILKIPRALIQDVQGAAAAPGLPGFLVPANLQPM